MKKQLLLVITVLAIGFAGCSKDKKETIVDDIVGKWFMTHVDNNGSWLPVNQSCLNGTYSEFTSSSKYISYDSCDDYTFNGTYTKKGNIVTCKVNAETITYTIIELNDNIVIFDLKVGSGDI